MSIHSLFDKLLDKLTENDWIFAGVVVLAFVGYLYLRNGPEYFTGTSGGAYWDNRKYCDTHPTGRMRIYSQLVGCAQIRAYRVYCERDVDGEITVDEEKIPCDRFLGVP